MRQKADICHITKGLIVQFGFVISAALILVSSLPEWEPRDHWGVLFTYTLLTIFSTFAPIRLSNTILTLNNAVIFSGILLFGSWVGVWSAVIEALIIGFLIRFHPVKALANIGQLMMTIWVVDVLKNWFNSFDTVSPIISDLLLAVIYWFVNLILCGLGISYFYKMSLIKTVKEMARGFTSTYLLLMILAGVGSRLVESYGSLTLIPMMVAFITISFVFHHYYDSVQKLQQKVEEIKTFNHKFLTTMAASIDARDRYTSGHSQRVAHWGREIAKKIGMPEDKVEELYFGGILHDIGKIGIEDEILNKKGRLTPEEYDKIKQHTVIGYEIILQAGMFNELLPAIRSHHERIDGKGYPDGLVGDEIPLMAKILAISDAFDAMVADRPYRKGLPVEEALNEIRRGSGAQFDEELAGHFIEIIQRMPREELESIIRQETQSQKQLQEAIY
ncbi:HD-GYP domain-containing protein [Brevibacillus choshinensis]|uniref:HD-GYP domain-containing protein n=1 Tax=Brevibacillus choshinensis TaxID=54911 RepID=UPI002E1B6F3D|nr:HD-GYP domain-containing protein [Brevibacillus choshinensis]MED4754693.1 HD-GYP domain-containing protein [Brevibacillus choshinensis]MED4780432.1 HD-GYP domain-containing protein [Brevibacillus choshinensis]